MSVTWAMEVAVQGLTILAEKIRFCCLRLV